MKHLSSWPKPGVPVVPMHPRPATRPATRPVDNLAASAPSARAATRTAPARVLYTLTADDRQLGIILAALAASKASPVMRPCCEEQGVTPPTRYEIDEVIEMLAEVRG